MAQIKKEEGRNAILHAAAELFSRKGYHDATLREISALAGMSLSNVYVYFRSKYDILFAINDPWVRSWFELLEQDAMLILDQRIRLEHIIGTVWRDVPAAHNGFARNIMQALSETSQTDGYDPTMLRWLEAKVNKLIISCLPDEQKARFADGQIAHIIMMAFDGFALNATVNPTAACSDLTVRAICGLLLPATQVSKGAKPKLAAKRRPRPAPAARPQKAHARPPRGSPVG
jgi:AcrR family transcriptional regulator